MSLIRYRRMRLVRDDGRVYLDRWGLQLIRNREGVHDRDAWGGIFLHVMRAPDPGIDLHDHPWCFLTVPVVGSYIEERSPSRYAGRYARDADAILAEFSAEQARGERQHVRRWRPRVMRLDECHRITDLLGRYVVTVVMHGPVRRTWGFYTADGFDTEGVYESTTRRPMFNDMTKERAK